MKKITMLVCLIIACSCYAGEPNDLSQGITLWAASADGADNYLNLLLGYERNRFEVGGKVVLNTYDLDGSESPSQFGGYMRYHINEFLGFDDPAPDSPWEEILHYLVARSYLGIDLLYSRDSRRIRSNFPIGTLFSVKEDPYFTMAFNVEYTFGDATDQNYVTLGMRFRTK